MYQWDAEEYRDNSSQQQRWAIELISKLRLKGDERVLDIGCGDGKVTVEIADFLVRGSIMGIDSSEEMISYARGKFPADKFPNVTFEKMDARDMSFSNEFDVVFSNATLHWVVDHPPVLGKIRESLNPRGRVVIQMGGKGNADSVLDIFEEMLKYKKWARFFNGFTFPYGFYGVEEYRQWLEESDLRSLRVELIPKDMTHKGKEGLSGWVRTTWLPYTQRLPEELQEDFIEELATRYIDRYPLDEDGLVHIAMVRLEVEAEKKDA